MFARSILLVGLLLYALPSSAQAPSITAVWPPGCQLGTALDARIEGSGFAGAGSILVSGRGVTAKAGSAAPDGTNIPVTFTIAKDADAGPHEIRVVTAGGVSTPGYLWVGPLPLVAEAGPNDRPERAMRLDRLPAAVYGRLDVSAKVDWLAFRAAPGETYVADVTAVRIYSRIDPVLELRDAAGRLLADASAGFHRDPRIIYTFREAGLYRIQVRDTMYRGGPGYVYLLNVGKVPVVTSLFPPGGSVGQTLTTTMNGANLGGPASWTVKLPADAPSGEWYAVPSTPNGPGLPAALMVDDLPQRGAPEATGPAHPYEIAALPAAIPGRILKRGQSDHYLVHGIYGKPITLAVRARECGSALDASIRVFDRTGKEIANTDDQAGRDPALTFPPPVTGDFRIQLSSVTGQSGPDCYYVLRAMSAGFRVTATPDVVSLGTGQTIAITVRAERYGGFDGPITIKAAGIPRGLSASPLALGPGENTGIMTITASESIPPAAVQVALTGESIVDGKAVTVTVQPVADLPGPGEDRVAPRPVRFQMLSVTDTVPLYTLAAEPTEVSLAPGQTAAIKVKAARKAGQVAAQGVINLALTEMPPGVTAEAPAIAEKQGETTIKITASADARPATRNALITGRLGESAQVAPALRITVKTR